MGDTHIVNVQKHQYIQLIRLAIVYLRNKNEEEKKGHARVGLDTFTSWSMHIIYSPSVRIRFIQALFICTHNHLKPRAMDINMHNWYVAKMLLFAI